MILALTLSGVVIVAIVLLSAVALFLTAVLLDGRRSAAPPYARYLDGLRRIAARVRS